MRGPAAATVAVVGGSAIGRRIDPRRMRRGDAIALALVGLATLACAACA